MLTELLEEDDAAHKLWGGDWKMPSSDQFWELTETAYTNQEWTTENGVSGIRVTSLMPGYEDRSIFLPAAGFIYSYGYRGDDGYSVHFWLREAIDQLPPNQAYSAWCNQSTNSMLWAGREEGSPIRPVKVQP